MVTPHEEGYALGCCYLMIDLSLQQHEPQAARANQEV